MQNYIIIANGNFLAKEIIQEATAGRIIISLDGAVNSLSEMGINPHIILGDFDSINEVQQHYWGVKKTFREMNHTDKPYSGNHNVLIVPAKNQTYTDLTKAIHYCDEQHAESIDIICALGGRLDHHEGAVRCLRGAYKKERPMMIHSDHQSLRFAKNETIVISGNKNDKCGIVGFPRGSFSSDGLQYDVQDYKLELGYSDNICNALQQKKATLKIEGEALIIMPLQLTNQTI